MKPKHSPSKTSKAPQAPSLADHEARLRAIEIILFGEGHMAAPAKSWPRDFFKLSGSFRSSLPKPFPSKAPKTKPLTTRTLNRRIAREQESADRHTTGLPPLKARKKPASK
jgi:hypothetical protein